MTYDPRQGQSPYLDMDDGETTYLTDDPFASQGVYEAQGAYDAQGVYDAQTVRNATQVAEVPRTVRRATSVPARAAAPQLSRTTVAPPLRRPVQEAPVAAVPAPSQRPYVAEPSPRPSVTRSWLVGPLATVLSLPVWLVGVGLRLSAVALSFLVVAATFLTGSMRANLLGALNLAPLLVPSQLLGQFVYETPFGGVLRGDLMAAALILFVADWLCMKMAASLRAQMRGGYR